MREAWYNVFPTSGGPAPGVAWTSREAAEAAVIGLPIQPVYRIHATRKPAAPPKPPPGYYVRSPAEAPHMGGKWSVWRGWKLAAHFHSEAGARNYADLANLDAGPDDDA